MHRVCDFLLHLFFNYLAAVAAVHVGIPFSLLLLHRDIRIVDLIETCVLLVLHLFEQLRELLGVIAVVLLHDFHILSIVGEVVILNRRKGFTLQIIFIENFLALRNAVHVVVVQVVVGRFQNQLRFFIVLLINSLLLVLNLKLIHPSIPTLLPLDCLLLR